MRERKKANAGLGKALDAIAYKHLQARKRGKFRMKKTTKWLLSFTQQLSRPTGWNSRKTRCVCERETHTHRDRQTYTQTDREREWVCVSIL